jgi:hypothetical protein
MVRVSEIGFDVSPLTELFAGRGELGGTTDTIGSVAVDFAEAGLYAVELEFLGASGISAGEFVVGTKPVSR